MSVKIMGLVWDLDNSLIEREEKYVLLAYVDHADHNGENIFPAVSLICKKTGYKERSVQMITRSLEAKGFLIADGRGPHGTNKWIYGGGAKIAGVQNLEARGAKVTPEGVQPVTPEPSVTVNKPSKGIAKKRELTSEETAEIFDSANKFMDMLLQNDARIAKLRKYPLREEFAKISDPLFVVYADTYVALTGQKPRKETIQDWYGTFTIWSGSNVNPELIQEAYEAFEDKVYITRPGSLTNKIFAIIGLRELEQIEQDEDSPSQNTGFSPIER